MIYQIRDNPVDYVGYATFVLNPTNLHGISGAGLARLFAEAYTDTALQYKAHCKAGRIGRGNLHISKIGQHSSIVCFPTKDHWTQDSDLTLIEENLKTFVRVLKSWPKASIVTPFLGAGLGKIPKKESLDLITRYLGDLPNPVFIADKQADDNLYYGIVGSRNITDYEKVRSIVSLDYEAIRMDIGCDFSDQGRPGFPLPHYSTIVSGGARGVDTLAEQYAKEFHLNICRIEADWDRYGKIAGNIRNFMIAKVAHAASAIVDHKSVGTYHTVSVLKKLRTPFRLTNIDKVNQERYA